MSQVHFVAGEWIEGKGEAFSKVDPSTADVILWTGNAAEPTLVGQAVMAARAAFKDWASLDVGTRIAYVETFAELLKKHQSLLQLAISQETGKPLWEAQTEVQTMINKVGISIQSYHERTGHKSQAINDVEKSTIRHKPHGVVAVLGPYNFPGHLPNGHIVPALIAGNTVVFKPSELTPLTAELTVKIWQEAGLPKGVMNLVQGGRETGKALVDHTQIDGIFFTGSANTGHALNKALADSPSKILALEMGGNNPLLVDEVENIPTALHHVIQSAFVSAGQRCTCVRRLLVPDTAWGAAFVEQLVTATASIKVGRYDAEPVPFMGPVISATAAEQLLNAQARLRALGAKCLLEMRVLQEKTGFLSPSIWDVTGIAMPDEEYFGPLLQLIRYNNLDEAMQIANHTKFGLASGILTDSQTTYEWFWRESRAGIINWNKPLTGAASSAPFGGVGASGNHRPSAYYAADYCAYPVSSIEASQLISMTKLPLGLENLTQILRQD